MEPFANHVPFFFIPSRFDPHRFQEFSLRKMVKKQYLSLPPDTVSPISKFLYRQDFGSLASCVKTKEKILQKIDQKEKHKAENIDPLYPVGPPLSRTGHRYLFPQGPLTGNLPPGMKPMHWQLPSCKYYPNGEKKYSGFFDEDCPGQYRRRTDATSDDEYAKNRSDDEALFDSFGP